MASYPSINDREHDLWKKILLNSKAMAQNAGQFEPSDIPGLGLWLDAYSLNDSLGYLDSVSLWPDESGNSRDATQSTGANQPRFLPWHGINYFHLPNVAGNYVSRPLADNTYDYVVTYEDGTTALGTKASTAGQWLFGVGDSDFAGKQVARVQLSLAGTLVSDLIANDANANNTTTPDRVSGTWTINRSGANPARIVSAPAVLFDGTDDYMGVSNALSTFSGVPGATLMSILSPSVVGVAKTLIRFYTNIPNAKFGQAASSTITQYGAVARRSEGAGVVSAFAGISAANKMSVLGCVADTDANEVYCSLDGVLATPVAWPGVGIFSAPDAAINPTIGASNTGEFFAGIVSTILAYRRALTDAEILQLSRYLATRANAGIVI